MDEKKTDPVLLDHHLAYLNFYNRGLVSTSSPVTYQDYLKAGNERLAKIADTFYPLCLL